MKTLLKILTITLSLCVSAHAMDDSGFMKMMTTRASVKEIPQKMEQLLKLKSQGVKLGLIIGRGNTEEGHAPLKGEDDGTITWVYIDLKRELLRNVSGKPYIWMNFDDLEQVAKIDSELFSHIYFDWSVLKFFKNIEKVITELKRICVNGGEILIPAGDQHGMVSAFPMETQIEERSFPLYAIYSMDKTVEAFERMSKIQEAFLKELFGNDNVQLMTSDIYPPAPEKKNNLSNYFVIKK